MNHHDVGGLMALIDIHVEYVPFFNFSYLQAFRKPLSSVTLTNNSDVSYTHVLLRIDSATDLLTDQDIIVENIPAHETVEIDCSGVAVDTHKLLQLTERVVDSIAFTVLDDTENPSSAHALGADRVEMIFWAFDQWTGTPETLPAFVTPNHPALAPLLIKASKYLEEWTGNPSIDGYQSGDTHRVRLQAAAIYRAIQEISIVYTGAPASFDAGQRIRLADAVLTQHLATCLDFSVLYASCLEAMDLRPLIFLIEGHAFAGLWLEEVSFPEILEEDPTSITRRYTKGIDQLTVVECTALAKESSVSFEDAERTAKHHFDNLGQFQCAVDVHRARMSQIIPLPTRIQSTAGWEVEVSENSALGKAHAPEKRAVSTAVLEVGPTKKTKKQLWERSLLDLSMHNNLLNMRSGSRTMPILAASLDEIEDTLAKDNDLIVAPRPEEWPDIDDEDAFKILGVSEEMEALLQAEFNEGRLRTLFSATSLKKNLTTLYRAATSSLEETGANTLFLTLGALRWFDEKRGGTFRYAPIILVPIDIVKKSAKEGYIIRMRDDEPQLNISLVEMLRSEFEISIDGLDPLPKDEAGVDTRLVLNTFKKKILNQSGWELLETITIGLFSFSQFVMWNDIRSREKDLRQSNIVNSMMEGHLTWTPEPLDDLDALDPSNLLLPVEADASQMIAIQNALHAKSFVLHGPPGTGKSQTITAIIANALARGQKVLFVAEKMAALEVVEKRLAALGLAPFCLEIHSTKATKHHVLEQIQAVSEIANPAKSEHYRIKADEVASLRQRLDTYAHGLSKLNAAGMSLREQICKYEQCKSEVDALGVEPLDVPMSFIEGVNSPQDFAVKINTIERIIAYALSVPQITHHPLRALTLSTYSQQLKERAPQLLNNYHAAMSQAHTAYVDIAQIFQLPSPQTLAQAATQILDLHALATSSVPKTALSAVADLDAFETTIQNLQMWNTSFNTMRTNLLTRWEEGFLGCDVEVLKRDWIDAQSKGFLGKSKAIKKVVSELQFYARRSFNAEGVEDALRELEQYQQVSQTIQNLKDQAQPALSAFSKPGAAEENSYDWDAIQTQLRRERELRAQPLDEHKRMLAIQNAEKITACGTVLTQATQAYELLANELGDFDRTSYSSSELLTSLTQTSSPTLNIFDIDEAIYQDVSIHLSSLRDWAQWNETKASARDLHLSFIVDYIEQVGISPTTFAQFNAGIYKTMCMASMDETEGINSFNSARFNETIKQYTRADEELRNLAKEEIYYRIASRIPNLTLESTHSSKAAHLQKALRSRGRNVSIRSLMRDCGDILLKLCPCVLMSPLSVSQYLEPGKEQFDLLIFDEASQLQTCKAIGALSRAKNALIVGDPKQMPPTSFFQGKVTEEDYEEVSDLESVLEDCLALNLPQTYLQWHYRSQHESLISFSNKRFYESKMLTFPSVDDRTSRVGYTFVSEGYFERGGRRVNEAEAHAIIDALIARSKDPLKAHESVGIVTLNIPQQTLIDDLFQQACFDDEDFDAWVQQLPEPLFIKNLENVQGDERDVIFFSITYAPDKTGKMSMNFGPINREGGWRRLNVAVTRARSGMHVFTSMHATDIDTQRASSMGPTSLRSFLEYAEKGSFSSVTPHELAQGMQSDTISDEIYEFLTQEGYTISRNVGKSTFKVDLAVVDPRDPGRYLAGILLDGTSYALASSTRDREISQPKILQRLGWHIYRIWTMDWWEDRVRTKQKLIEFLNQTYKDTDEEVQRILKERVLRAKPPKSAENSEPQAESTTNPSVAPEQNASPQSEPTTKPDTSLVSEPTTKPITESEAASISLPTDEQKATSETALTAEPKATTEQLHIDSQPIAHPLHPLDEASADALPKVAHEMPSAPTLIPATPLPTATGDKTTHSTDDVEKLPYVITELHLDPLESDAFLESEDALIATALQQVIDTEAPIEIKMAYKRVTRAYGIARLGNKIEAKCDRALKKAQYTRTTQAGRSILWRKDQDPKTYLCYRVTDDDETRRNADELPLEEIATACIMVLKTQGALPQDELIKAASVELGYKRVANTVTDFFKRGIKLAARRKFIERTNGTTYEYIPKENRS